jgi:hypothetical protein
MSPNTAETYLTFDFNDIADEHETAMMGAHS